MCYGYGFKYLHSDQNHCNHHHLYREIINLLYILYIFLGLSMSIWRSLLNFQSLMHYYYYSYFILSSIQWETSWLCNIKAPRVVVFYVIFMFFVVFFDYKFKSAIIIINATWVRHPIKHRMQFNVFLFQHTQLRSICWRRVQVCSGFSKVVGT